jgi:predicted DNA-binding protein
MTTRNPFKTGEPAARYRVKPALTRINARLDPARMQTLEALAKTKGLSLSDVLREAIDHYAQAQHAQNAPSAFEIMERIGFIGCGKGPSDLSTNLKKYLTEGLSAKHGYR